MEPTLDRTPWRSMASELANRLRTDWRNGRMLSDPWSRAAHSMVQGWRIRLSRPPARRQATWAAPTTWKAFASRALVTLAAKVRPANQSPWRRWAGNRVSPGSRYIPKAKRR